MSFLIDLISGGWAKLAGVFGVVAAIAAGWLSIRKSGRDAERVKQTEAWNATQTRVEQAVAPVSRLDDAAVRDELRQRASTPSPRNPV